MNYCEVRLQHCGGRFEYKKSTKRRTNLVIFVTLRAAHCPEPVDPHLGNIVRLKEMEVYLNRAKLRRSGSM